MFDANTVFIFFNCSCDSPLLHLQTVTHLCPFQTPIKNTENLQQTYENIVKNTDQSINQ